MTEEMRDAIIRLRQGDSRAFRVLFDAYADKGLRFASAYVRDEDQAKDIVQETFIRIYRNIGSFDMDRYDIREMDGYDLVTPRPVDGMDLSRLYYMEIRQDGRSPRNLRRR